MSGMQPKQPNRGWRNNATAGRPTKEIRAWRKTDAPTPKAGKNYRKVLLALVSVAFLVVAGIAIAVIFWPIPPRPISLVLLGAGMAHAQGFGVGTTDIGPVVGLGGLGDAGLAIGGRFEHGIKTLPSLNDGGLALAIGVDHYSFTGFSFTPISVAADYHFRLMDARWDPFLGLGLSDYVASCGGVVCVNSTPIPFSGYMTLTLPSACTSTAPARIESVTRLDTGNGAGISR